MPHPSFVDLTGKRFGKLVVLERVADTPTKSGKKLVTWKCRCDCGNVCNIRSSNLKSGNTKSCGCFAIDFLLCKQRLFRAVFWYKGNQIRIIDLVLVYRFEQTDFCCFIPALFTSRLSFPSALCIPIMKDIMHTRLTTIDTSERYLASARQLLFIVKTFQLLYIIDGIQKVFRKVFPLYS